MFLAVLYAFEASKLKNHIKVFFCSSNCSISICYFILLSKSFYGKVLPFVPNAMEDTHSRRKGVSFMHNKIMGAFNFL